MNNIRYYITVIVISLLVAIIFSQYQYDWIVYSGFSLLCFSSILCLHLSSIRQINSIVDVQNGETANNIDKSISLLIELHNNTKEELDSVKGENTQIQGILNTAIEGLVASFQGLQNESNLQKNMVFELVEDVSNESDNHHTIKDLAHPLPQFL